MKALGKKTSVRRQLRSNVACARGVVLKLDDAPAPAAEGETPAETEVPKRKWIHVATEGSFAGHGDGEFTLDLGVFKAFIERLHADPQYKAGDDGIGTNPVIPFDYEHASEMPPTEGSIPSGGAPAPAWVLDLKVEKGEDGKVQLWAYAELGDQIRKQMLANEYRFVSIAFTLESVDPVTAEPAGPKLTSIAFTNHPFLRDLTPYAASEGGARRLRYYYGDCASSPEQALEYTRSILQVPATYTMEQVLAELAKVVSWVEKPEGMPAGIQPEFINEVMGNLRCAWGVPVTTTNSELLQSITTAVGNIAKPAEQQTPAPAPAAAPAATPAAAATESTETTTMSAPALSDLNKKIVTILASRKGQAVLRLDDEQAVLQEVESAVAAKADLGEVLKSLGYATAAEALAGIPDLRAALTQVTDLKAQLEEALAMQTQVEETSEEADVDAAMSAKGYDSTDKALRNSLSVYRKSLLTAELDKALAAQPKDSKGVPKPLGARQLSEARTAGRKAFFTAYGINADSHESLLKNIVAGPNGQQLRAPTPEARQLSIHAPKGAQQINLSAFPGPNSFAKLCAYVRTEKGFENASPAAVASRASKLRSDKNVVIVEQ